MAEREQLDDRALVGRILGGDRDRFTDLVRRYEKRLVNYVYRITHRYEEAHDLAQEVFVKVYVALDRYDPKYQFSTWLFRIAANLISDRYQRSGREISNDFAIESAQVSPAQIEEVERRATLFRLVDTLPTEQKKVLVLRFVEQKSIKEVAREIRKTEGAVKQLQFRALTSLRARMEGADA